MENAMRNLVHDFITSRCPLTQDVTDAEGRMNYIIENYSQEFTNEVIDLIITELGEEVFEI